MKTGLRPVRSTLSRRVRGVLSPYRERGIRRLRAASGAGFPAFAGMTMRGGSDGKEGRASAARSRGRPAYARATP